MYKLGLALLFLLGEFAVLDAADRVRMGFPDLAAQFLPLPLAEKRDFLKEQGLQGEFIRIRPAISSAALVSGEIDYDTVLGALSNLNGTATLNFGSLNLSGLTILGAHFGNNIESDPNNITAFWLLDLGSTTTHTITLSNGQGSSNAQIFAMGGTPGVPEPATWAMMLLGFAGIGTALRGRAQQKVLMQVA